METSISKLIVVNNPKKWPLEIPGIRVVSARDYLMDPAFINMKGGKIFNLCRTYRYQSTGYYVSLLAAARGHKAFPDIQTIEEMKSPALIRIITGDLDELIQKSLSGILARKFTLSIYFGKNVARKYDQLSLRLFAMFQAPLLRAYFSRKGSAWRLNGIQLISANDIPDEHFLYVISFAHEYFMRKSYRVRRKKIQPYDMAILAPPPEDPEPPSDEKAMRKLMRAAEDSGFNVELINKEDINRVAEFDALLIRDTTSVNHYTFRMAQRAEAEGLVVIDDPVSILKCTNKVYLAELMKHCHISSPETVIFNRETMETVPRHINFPIILKQPDSFFSKGVVKVRDMDEFVHESVRFFEKSDLIIAQEFMPTDFDWRVGIFDRKPIFVCKYYMANSHWQVMNWEKTGTDKYGSTETFRIEDAPDSVVKLALRAANLIGDGLYGVDLKVYKNRPSIIEINDNPNLDSGTEDACLKDDLYRIIMNVFLERVKKKQLMQSREVGK